MSALCTKNGSLLSKKGRAFFIPPPVSSNIARSSLMWIVMPKSLLARRNSIICSPKWWILIVISLNPASFSRRITRSNIGFPATETSALGVWSVSGRRRVPSPAANIIAFTVYLFALKFCSIFCSLCIKFTCTPNFLFRCSAKCCAEYTERC